MGNTYIVCAIVGGIGVFAFFRGWNKTGLMLLVLFGVMLATTAIGPHLQHGVATGVDAAITTISSFFH
jgi:hypothetical protein